MHDARTSTGRRLRFQFAANVPLFVAITGRRSVLAPGGTGGLHEKQHCVSGGVSAGALARRHSRKRRNHLSLVRPVRRPGRRSAASRNNFGGRRFRREELRLLDRGTMPRRAHGERRPVRAQSHVRPRAGGSTAPTATVAAELMIWRRKWNWDPTFSAWRNAIQSSRAKGQRPSGCAT